MSSISVVIPAYNAESVLGATIQSVLEQESPAEEVIVVDDGSRDGTVAVARSFGRSVTVVEQENRGTSAARHVGIERATGEWVALLDSDDLWHPRYLVCMREALQWADGVVVVFSEFRDLLRNEPPGPWWDLDDGPLERLGGLEFCERYLRRSGMTLPSFSLVRRSIVGRQDAIVLPRDLSGSEDLFLWYDLARFGAFLHVPVELGHYRLLEGSLSNDRVRMYPQRIPIFQTLSDVYRDEGPDARAMIDRHLTRARRHAARYLFGAGQEHEARALLHDAIREGHDFKSLAVLLKSYLPRPLRSDWPERYRIPLLSPSG